MQAKIRIHQAGDIGWIISKHGEIYTQEFGFDPGFETHIANKFAQLFAPNCSAFNRIWLVEVAGNRAGSIAVWKKSQDTTFINFVILEKIFRGQGISKLLLRTAIQHSREANFKSIELETYSCLSNARDLYKNFGFKITQTDKAMNVFGQITDREFWELEL